MITPRVQEIAEEALKHRDPKSRQAFVDRECATEPDLRQRVIDLLTKTGAMSGGAPLADPDNDATRLTMVSGVPTGLGAWPQFDLAAGTVIANRYTLVEKLGEGGMGEVWVARQSEPVRRQVALKVIRAGMDSQAVLARFEAERQALALMDHPGIAKVLDGGSMSDMPGWPAAQHGRPFFVMELVDGQSLTDYCDQGKLPLRERLEIFVQVCRAVQHAHQKGVLHRDLKPSNVLVTELDGKPVAKVIDFGLAKALGGTESLTTRDQHTVIGTVIGTPLYMSPEQLGVNDLDVDTRSDIYSLGVLLYELLTGATPLERQRMTTMPMYELIRQLREVEPTRPSARLGEYPPEQRARLAALRSADPVRLPRQLRGELDWIAAKALEKDRERRYETANALARDVERYLADEPVRARPPSVGYRLLKFGRRNWPLLAAAALLFLALSAGIIGTGLGLLRAHHAEAFAKEQARLAGEQRDRATDAMLAEQKALAAERKANQEAKRRAEEAEAVAGFLVDVFRKPHPAADGRDLKVADLLRQAREGLGEGFQGDPAIRAALLAALGQTFTGLGMTREAEDAVGAALKLREEVLGPDHPETLASRNSLAQIHLALGRLSEAAALHEETLRRRTEVLGDQHADTLASRGNLASVYLAQGRAADALRLHTETLALRQAILGTDHEDTLAAQSNVATALLALGKYGQASQLLSECSARFDEKFGPDHPHALLARGNLADALLKMGRGAEAVRLHKEVLALRESKLGEDHPDTLVSRNNLATALAAVGQAAEAVTLHETNGKLAEKKYGSSHPITLGCRGNLAEGYLQMGRADLAAQLHGEVLRARLAQLGPLHPETLVSRNNLAAAQLARGRHEEARALHEENLKLREKALGLDHPDTLSSRNNLAAVHAAAGRQEEAARLYELTVSRREEVLGPSHPDTLVARSNLASARLALGQKEEAARLFEETLRRGEAELGPEHPKVIAFRGNLAEAYRLLDRTAEAIALFTPALAQSERAYGPQHPSTLTIVGNLAKARLQAGAVAEAITLFDRCLAAERHGQDETRYTSMLVGVARELLRHRQFAEAEKRLRECLALREKRLPTDWRTCNVRSLLGEALAGQGRRAEAEKLLLDGYEGLKTQAGAIPPQFRQQRLTEAVDRLISHYQALDQPEAVKQWQAERLKWK